MTELESIDKWVEDVLVWAVNLQDEAKEYHASLVKGLAGSEASFDRIKKGRNAFQPMWLVHMEGQIRELASNNSAPGADGQTIDEVEDKFYEIKPTLDLLDLAINAIRALGIHCICETNNTMHCPVHEARTYTKDKHGIDGSMGEFDTI